MSTSIGSFFLVTSKEEAKTWLGDCCKDKLYTRQDARRVERQIERSKLPATEAEVSEAVSRVITAYNRAIIDSPTDKVILFREDLVYEQIKQVEAMIRKN